MHSNSNQQILDTFVFKNQKITYKHEHAERTFETFCYLYSKLDSKFKINATSDQTSSHHNIFFNNITTLYSQIEADLAGQYNHHPLRVRLIFDCLYSNAPTLTAPAPAIEITNLSAISEPQRLNVVLTPHPPLLDHQYKFADRSHWHQLLTKKLNEADDILLVNLNNEAIETSRFNIFLYDEQKDLFITPPLNSGCLNGVLRRTYLKNNLINTSEYQNKKLIEAPILLEKISDHNFFVGNSVRGFLNACLIK